MDFQIQTGHPIPARRADFVLINKKERNYYLLDFQIQRGHPIPARRADFVLINKKQRNCHLLDFQIQTGLPIPDRRADLVLINKKERKCYLLDFQIRTGHPIPTRRPELSRAKKKKKNLKRKENLLNSGLYRQGKPQTENQRKRKEILRLIPCQRSKTFMEHEGDGDIIYKWRTWKDPERFG